MKRNDIKCPLCGCAVRDSLEALIDNDYRTTCRQCGSPLQIIGDYAYIPLDSEQAEHLHQRATTPPELHRPGDDAPETGGPVTTVPSQLSPDGRDPLLPEVVRFLTLCNAITPVMLCRRFGISHERANDILDTLERDGMVGPAHGGAPRSILIPHNTALPGSTLPSAMGGGTVDGNETDDNRQPRVYTLGCTGCLPSLLLSLILIMALKACGAF